MVINGKNMDGNRRVENDRLVYYKQNTTSEYWENLWEKEITEDRYTPFKAGNLFEFARIFPKHLPKTGRVLEAGCGTAQFVVALNAQGYDCFGLDYAYRAMRRANELAGPLPLICGDITSFGLANDVFEAVISIGVVEHRREGPEPFLDEMWRVLKPEGIMLISVPCFNPLRRYRAQRGAYQDDVQGLGFYQYAFTPAEFCMILEQAGFIVEKTYTYAHQNTLNQELHWLKTVSPFVKKLFLRFSKYIPVINSRWGHMLMVIARKRK